MGRYSLLLFVLLILSGLGCDKIELPTTGSLEVAVSGDLQAISGATVTLTETGQSETTDDFGRARFRDIPTSTYTVQVTHPDYAAGVGQVQVKDHPVAVLKVLLDPSPHLPRFSFYTPHSSQLAHTMTADDTLTLNIGISNQADSPIRYTITSDIQGVLVAETEVRGRIRDRLYDLEIGKHNCTLTATSEGDVQTTATFTLDVLPVPSAPVITDITVAGNVAAVTWSAVDHPLLSRYELRQATDETDNFTYLYSGKDTRFEHEIPFGRSIRYRVVAIMRNGTTYTGPIAGYDSPIDRISFAGNVRESALLPQANRLYVTTWNSPELSVVNTTDWSVERTVTLPADPDAILLSSDREELYVHLGQEATLRVYRSADLSALRTIPLLGRAESSEPAIANHYALLGEDRILYGGYGSLTNQINLADPVSGDTLATIRTEGFRTAMFVGSEDGNRIFVSSGNAVTDHAVTDSGVTLRQRAIRNRYYDEPLFLPGDQRVLIAGRDLYDPADLSRQLGILDDALLFLADDGKTGVTAQAVIDVDSDAKLFSLPGRTILAAVDPLKREIYFTLWDAREELYRLSY